MNTDELTEHLHNATADLEPPAGFAETVLRGGRRRRGRRRMVVAASVVAVAAIATTATVVALRDVPQQVQAADPRLTQPTRGDLAGDQAFLDQALTAWRNDLGYAYEASFGYYDDRRGEPRVFWAGNTPAGRAAIVVQQVYVHKKDQVRPENVGLRVAEGLIAVDPADGKLKLVSTREIERQNPGWADYYKFGPEDRTLLIVDHGEPLHYSFTRTKHDAGFEREWQQARPHDGVALIDIPAGSAPADTAAFEGNDPPELEPPDVVSLDPGEPLPVFKVLLRETASTYLDMRLTDPAYRAPQRRLLDWGEVAWEFGTPLGLSEGERDSMWGAHLATSYGRLITFFQSDWTVTVGLPDGRVVILREGQVEEEDPRLIAMVSSDRNTTEVDMVDGGPVDKDGVLPVRFRIPDGGGWIVADKGKALSYRTRGGEWTDAGRDAALLPDDTVEVKVDGQVVTL